MSQNIRLKRSAVPGRVPTIEQLELGEIALNTYDGKLYLKQDVAGNQSVIAVGSSSDFATSASHADNAISASYALTASYAPGAGSSISASYAATASSADDFTVRGTLTAQTIVVQTITSSIEFVTGSSRNGSLLTNTHQFTGSVSITGSLSVNGSDYTNTSASFDQRILSNSASIDLLSGSYLISSASFDTRILNNSASISSLSGSYLNSSASFDTRITNNSASIAQLSSSFLTFSGSYNTGSFTGSFTGTLTGTASYATQALTSSFALTALSSSFALTASYWSGSIINATSASYAVTSSYSLQSLSASLAQLAISASYATTASYALNGGTGGGGISAIYIADEGNIQGTASYFDFNGAGVTATVSNNTASITITGGGGGGDTNSANAILNQTVAATTWSFDHNLATQYPVFTIYDANDDVIIPQRIHTVTTSSALIYFSSARTGTAVASKGGNVVTASAATSASYALSASYSRTATSASYALNATTASYALTALTASYAPSASYAERAIQLDVYVKNTSGAQINKGTVVRIIDAVGDNPLIVTASYNNDNNSANTLGITTQNIPNDSFGYIISEGILIGINTENFVAGQLLYLGPTGSIIGTAPVAPLHAVRLGEVLRVQQNNGSIYVRIDNGIELGEAHDVRDTTTTGSYGDILIKSGSVWTNSKQLTGSYGLTGSLTITDTLTAQTLVVQTITSSIEFITGSTRNGSLLTNTHQFTGSASITGSLAVNGSNVILSNQTSSMTVLSASYAESASLTTNVVGGANRILFNNGVNTTTTSNNLTWNDNTNLLTLGDATGTAGTISKIALYTSSYGGYGLGVSPAQLDYVSDGSHVFYKNGITPTELVRIINNGDVYITGDLYATGSIKSNGINSYLTGSLQGTASYALTSTSSSYANNATSASFALTASYISGSGGGVGFPFSGSAVITGSLFVSQSFVDLTQATYVTGSFTGSFLGTGSYATYALSASNAPGFTTSKTQSISDVTWSFVHNLNTRNPLLQVYDSNYNQIIPNEIIAVDALTAEIHFDYSASGYAVASNGGGLYITGSTSRLDQTSAAVTWSFTHNLNTKYPAFEVYDENDFVVIPSGIRVINENSAELYFGTPSIGKAIANFSGINGAPNATTASYSVTSEWNGLNAKPISSSLGSAVAASTTVVAQIATASYSAAFFDYAVISGSNSRAGTVMSVWNGGNIEFTDTSTSDIGNTDQVTMSVDLSGANVRLKSTTTDAWTVKSLIRLI